MNHYTPEVLSDNISRTPEGFLLCRNVVIARTGEQIYGPYETPVPLGNDGLVRILREADEVFRKETIDSFAGKPVTLGHPDAVTPETWGQLAVGVVLDPRRGTGEQSEYLLADLLITDKRAIDEIIDEDGLPNSTRQVSCGYDAKYVVLSAGLARQRFIVGNHVALVPKARCGEVCSIKDHATTDCCDEEESMSFKERLKLAITGKDEKKALALLDELPIEGEKPETHVHVHVKDSAPDDDDKDKDKDKDDDKKTKDAIAAAVKDCMSDAVKDAIKPVADAVASLDARMKKVEAKDAEDDPDDEGDDKDKDKETKDHVYAFADEAPRGTKDSVIKGAKDSKLMEDAFQETIALAEVITPGVSVPTFDAAIAPKSTIETLCKFRRTVLDSAYKAQPEVATFMDSMLGGREFKTYDCGGVRSMFLAVGAQKKKLNNDAMSNGGVQLFAAPEPKRLSPADRNKRNAEFFKQ